METTVLEMIFENGYGKNFTVSVKEPREDLIPSEVESAMNAIATLNIFEVPGPLLVKGAQVVTRQVNELEFS